MWNYTNINMTGMFSLFWWSSCPINPVYGLSSCISNFLLSSREWTLFCISSSNLSTQEVVIQTSIFIQNFILVSYLFIQWPYYYDPLQFSVSVGLQTKSPYASYNAIPVNVSQNITIPMYFHLPTMYQPTLSPRMVNQHLLPYIKVLLTDTNHQVIPSLLLFIQVSVLSSHLVIIMKLRLFLPLLLTQIYSQYWSMRILDIMMILLYMFCLMLVVRCITAPLWRKKRNWIMPPQLEETMRESLSYIQRHMQSTSFYV